MAVTMTFYSNFKKKDNSTKRPTSGTAYNVVFKDAFSIIGGTVKLQVSFDTAQNYTAAKYGTKYYKVTDVVSTSNGIVEISLNLDVLATYHNEIGNYRGLIARANSKKNQKYLPDNQIINTGEIWKHRQVGETQSILTNVDAVTVQVKTNNAAGAQSIFMSKNAFSILVNQLDKFYEDNTISLITEINFLYVDPSFFMGAPHVLNNHKVYIGKEAIDVSPHDAYACFGPSMRYGNGASVSLEGQFSYVDARKIDSRFTRLSAYVNNTEIPLDPMYNMASKIVCNSWLDLNTLSVMIQVGAVLDGFEKPVYTGYTNVGIGFALANDNNDTSKFITAGLKATGQALLGAGVALATGGLATPLMAAGVAGASSLLSDMPSLSQTTPMASAGSVPGSTLSDKDLDFRVYLTEFGSTFYSKSEYGYPYFELNSILSLIASTDGEPGFYQFANPQISVAAPEGVRNKINEYMLRGIYYEV